MVVSLRYLLVNRFIKETPVTNWITTNVVILTEMLRSFGPLLLGHLYKYIHFVCLPRKVFCNNLKTFSKFLKIPTVVERPSKYFIDSCKPKDSINQDIFL